MNTSQKIIKYVAIVFAICLIIGIFTGICRVAKILGGVLTVKVKGNGLNIYEYSSDDNILSIDIASAELTIKTGESLKVESNNEYITSEQDHNKLSVTEKTHKLSKGKNKPEVIIYIPENIIFDKVYISNGAGTIDIQKLKAEELELEIGAGKVNIDNVTALSNTKIEGGAGEVVITNTNFNNLNLQVGVGKFTLNSILTGESKILAGVGELNINLLNNKDNYTIDAETGIGTLLIDGKEVNKNLKYGNGANKIKLEGGIGSIRVDFKD